MALRLPVDRELARATDGPGQAMPDDVEFRVGVAHEHGGVCICPIGDVDLATIGHLRERVAETMAGAADRVILDLRATTFLDSTGLHLVLDTDAWAKRNGTEFLIIAGPPAVQHTFEAAGLTGRLPFVEGTQPLPRTTDSTARQAGPGMSSPFDRALETRVLMAAAREFASRHGEPGSPAYRAAWLRFRQQPTSTEGPQARRGQPRALDRDWIAVLRVAIERAMLIDGASMANAQVVDPRTRGLRIVAHTGFPTEFLDFFELVEHTSNSACGRALANASAVWVPDTARSPIFAGSAALEVMLDAGSRGVATVPVKSPDGDVIAMISTHHRRPASWTHGQQLGLERLARTTGRILHRLHPPAAGQSEAQARRAPSTLQR
jgi:anti-anti-sigma factor